MRHADTGYIYVPYIELTDAPPVIVSPTDDGWEANMWDGLWTGAPKTVEWIQEGF